MLVRASSFTVDLGENGYLIGFTDDYAYPAEMPFGWRCGPATGEANAVVLTTTETGPLHLTVQVYDGPPPPEAGGDWELAEEMSLRVEVPALCLATLEQGDVLDAWPQDQVPLDVPASDSGGWVRMRLYCHADDPEPGIGDHGERHLVQFWPTPHMPPVHPDITQADRQARAEYAADQALPVDDYTITYPDVH
ncbi:hypothetical protein ACFYO5_37895 [Streptomyces sp. NPDC006259]|uniref:hypothetical protein n=1 Tax=Streptomyces sp. NPDC006259 TaxID=3364740 RepID=UPI0036A69B9C